MTHDFWWHLWHDPLNENPVAIITLVVIVGVVGVLFLVFPRRWK